MQPYFSQMIPSYYVLFKNRKKSLKVEEYNINNHSHFRRRRQTICFFLHAIVKEAKVPRRPDKVDTFF